MADNITIKDGAGSDVTMRSTNTAGIIQVPMSIPTNTAGNAAAFGSGGNGATVPRFALATDSPGAGVAQGSTTSGQTIAPIGGAVTTGNPAYTTAQTSPASLDTAGNLRVVNGAAQYETVAASQTGQTIGPTGATGDYLSHIVIYPTSTSPGVVTVFDNSSSAAANVVAFPGGASSLSNLAPIPIPVGAVSTAGAWKVTTGLNVVVSCYGKFT